MRKKRVIIWTLALALVGALLETKRATFRLDALITGAVIGGLIGFCIGLLVTRLKTNPGPR